VGSIQLLSASGKAGRQVELPGQLFERQGRDGLVWESVRCYLANQRQGTAKVKTVSEVSGTGKKPYRQKHTGRARHGTRRSPIFVGGGIIFGPHPRDYSYELPKKIRQQALALALSAKHADGAVSVVEDFDVAQPKTKDLAKLLTDMGITGSVLMLAGGVSPNLVRASRNISWLTLIPARQANPYLVLSHERVLITEQGLKELLALQGVAS
jgi:large subunit ribosomal protein L4